METEKRMRVLIAGGGVAALESLMALRDLAADRVDLTLVAPAEEFVYAPHAVTEPFALGHALRVPLRKVARDFDADLVHQSLSGVWPSVRVVRLSDGSELGYDRLIVAIGARREPVFEHALTFGGGPGGDEFQRLVHDVETGACPRVAFVVPGGPSWSLPLYELALMTAQRAREARVSGAAITLVTPEEHPLAVFGPTAGDDLMRLLDDAGIRIITSSFAEVPEPGMVIVRPDDDVIECDCVVALPRLRGIPLRSLPHDSDGFLPIDNHGRVRGVDAVFAAGDGTDFPIKQGGIACQQADAAAEVIARAAGAAIEPRSFRPVLRGRLATGREPRFMRTDLSGREGDASETALRALWWPPSKISGRYLAPYLGESAPAPV
jgi:sulfide:quinone oxidoreductase